MADEAPSSETKLTRTKRLRAAAGKFLVGRSAQREEERLPPTQHLVKDWPAVDLDIVPAVPLERFRLDWQGQPLGRSVAGRCAPWCRTSTSGRAPNG
jgi:hypothetical protein